MSSRPIHLTPELHDYLLHVSLREHPVLRRLREETQQMPRASMQISPEQGQLMALLVKLLGARKTLEVGTFTGYSSLAVALALPPGGKVVCCDVSEEWTSIARRAWAEAGVADRVELHLAPATETLARFLREGQAGTFDFAFIDADKAAYDTYVEQSYQLLRTGGLIAIDNVLWSGRVADPSITDADTSALRALNAKLQKDERFDLSMLPIADGLTLLRKR